MAFDHYVAICKPLHYTTIMNRHYIYKSLHYTTIGMRGLLMGVVWLGGFLHATIQVSSSSDDSSVALTSQITLSVIWTLCSIWPALIPTPYGSFWLPTVVPSVCQTSSTLMASSVVILRCLRTRSLEERHKAISTRVSHITVVILFFVPGIFVYMRPTATLSTDEAVAVFCTIITPTLNPFIYTLRNVQMKTAIRKLCSRKSVSGDK